MEEHDYDMGYGGVLIGYDWIEAGEKTSLNFQLLNGYGGISEKSDESLLEKSNFWVVRPGAEVEFGINHWLRVGVGGGYRWIWKSNLTAFSDRNLSAPYGSITLKFGNFNF